MGRGRDVLSGRRRGILRRLAVTACPPDVARPEVLDRVVDQVEVTAAALPPTSRGALLAAIDLAGLPSPGRRSRRASPSGWGPLRRTVRDVLVLAYYDQPEVKARLGYDPDAWTAEVAGPRAARWATAIEDHRAVVLARAPRPPREG